MRVVFDEQHAARVAAFQVWVNVGSADERADQAGLAHLHEHMLFKGTAGRGPGEIAREIEAHGGEINAWTSFDQTVYHVVIASQYARLGLDVLADALRHSAFEAGELSRELEVVCEEIKRSEDTPSRRASKDLFATSFQAHPYRNPVIGTEASVRAFSREQVLGFYGEHYTPANVVLAAAGDFKEADLRRWAEEAFGGAWGRPRSAPAARPVEPTLVSPRLCLRADPVKEAYLSLAFQVPPADHDDVPALDLLAMVAGQGEASRLTLEVKRRRSLVNDVHAYAYTPKDPGLFVASLTAQPAQLEAALEATAGVLARLRESPVPESELATVKALVECEAVYQRETVQGLARKLGYYEAALGGIEREARYYERIGQVTPGELRDVARRYLDFGKAVVTGLLPPGSALDEQRTREALRRAERPPANPNPTPTPFSPSGVEGGPSPAPPRDSRAEPATPLRLTPLAARRGDSRTVVTRLSGGGAVVVREESAVPLFAMRAVFPGGLRYETDADNGLTSLLCRMLTRGTPTRDAESISRLVDELAGSLSGAGGRNSVSLRGEFLSRHFERAFELFADCLAHPSFPEAELLRERALLLQDIATRDDKPSGLAFELLARTLYRRHPYRLAVSGEAASVEKLDAAALRAYHDRHMDSSQLTLCVVGDVSTDRVLALAEAAFGRAGGKARPPPEVPVEPPLEGPRQALRPISKAQTHLVLGYPAAKVADPWRRALEVLSTVLSGQGGRLFLELRDKRSMAYSVSSFSVEGVDPGYFAVYMGTSPEKVDAALAGIRAELARMRDEPLPAVELERAKQHLIGTHEIGLQRNGARAAVMALDHCYGLGAERFLRYAEEVTRVTAEEVGEVARRVLDPAREALAVVGP